MHYVIGVDLGLDGGVALLNSEGRLLRLEKMPVIKRTVKRKSTKAGVGYEREFDIKGCRLLLSEMPSASWGAQPALVMEGGLYGQSAQAVRSLYRGEAIWETLACVYGVPVQSVHPRTWQAYFVLRNDKDLTAAQNKATHRARATELWPEYAKQFAPVGADGLADAALLAEYVRRTGGES